MPLVKYLKQTFQSPYLVKNVLPGAGIGLTLIRIFLFKADKPNPEWHLLGLSNHLSDQRHCIFPYNNPALTLIKKLTAT